MSSSSSSSKTKRDRMMSQTNSSRSNSNTTPSSSSTSPSSSSSAVQVQQVRQQIDTSNNNHNHHHSNNNKPTRRNNHHHHHQRQKSPSTTTANNRTKRKTSPQQQRKSKSKQKKNASSSLAAQQHSNNNEDDDSGKYYFLSEPSVSEESLISSCSNSSSLVGFATTTGTASASIVVVSPGGGGGDGGADADAGPGPGPGPGAATKMKEEKKSKSNILIPTLNSSDGGEEKELEEEKCNQNNEMNYTITTTGVQGMNKAVHEMGLKVSTTTINSLDDDDDLSLGESYEDVVQVDSSSNTLPPSSPPPSSSLLLLENPSSNKNVQEKGGVVVVVSTPTSVSSSTISAREQLISPESERYLTADESSPEKQGEDHDDDDDDSSDLSYDSSSSSEEQSSNKPNKEEEEKGGGVTSECKAATVREKPRNAGRHLSMESFTTTLQEMSTIEEMPSTETTTIEGVSTQDETILLSNIDQDKFDTSTLAGTTTTTATTTMTTTNLNTTSTTENMSNESITVEIKGVAQQKIPHAAEDDFIRDPDFLKDPSEELLLSDSLNTALEELSSVTPKYANLSEHGNTNNIFFKVATDITPLLPGDDEPISPVTNKSMSSSDNQPTSNTERVEEDDDEIATAADDEQDPKPRRKRIFSGESGKRHRRNRSGDDVAATILTGGTDWKGMELDQLPLPNERANIDDEDDEDDDEEGVNNLQKGEITERQMEENWMALTQSNSRRESSKSPHESRNVRFGGDAANKTTKEKAAEELESRRRSKSSLKKLKEKGGPAWATIRNSSPNDMEENWSHSSEGNFPNYLPEKDLPRQNSTPTSDNGDLDFHLTSSSDQQPHKKKMHHEDRQESLGDASLSTIESHGSQSAFSWISNKGASVLSGRRDSQTVAESSLNFSDQSDNEELFGTFDEGPHPLHRPLNEELHGKLNSPERLVPSDDLGHRPITPPGRNEWQENESNPLQKQTEPISVHSRSVTPDFYPNMHRPIFELDDDRNYPTYTCPRCNTKQRQFFTVNSAPKKYLSGPGAYIGVIFAIYIIGSLFIFGVEEGWPLLDCFYFSVMTMTSVGLGDYTPTSDSAKIICSIFIYFGVMCIGLILGSLHANSLDEAAKKTEKENIANNCPYCAQVAARKKKSSFDSMEKGLDPLRMAPRVRSDGEYQLPQKSKPNTYSELTTNHTYMGTQLTSLHTISETSYGSTYGSTNDLTDDTFSSVAKSNMGLFHTRHSSLDTADIGGYSASLLNKASISTTPTNNNSVFDRSPKSDFQRAHQTSQFGGEPGVDGESDEDSWSLASNDASENEIFRPVSKVKAAKYFFLTLRQAFANSMLILAIGSFGFYYIERMSVVNAFYFTTVLLTTVGYGDITPRSPEGKLFATAYILVAGYIMLHNMTMISMIPLELRKRRLERAVLEQFGDDLDDAALRELATGPLVKRLQISENRPDGLDQCTREMFALAMLVRLGRISEQDVKLTYNAFQRLDKDNDGVLTSREIIMSEAERKKRKQSEQQWRERHDDSNYREPAEYLSLLQHPLSSQNSQSASAASTQTSDRGPPPRMGQRQRGLSFEDESQFSAITADDEDVGQHHYNWNEDAMP